MIYNDTSVLEQHHCYEAFRILKRQDCNILATLSPEQSKLARKYIISCILATDLAEHNKWLELFKAKREKLNWDEFEDKKLIMCILVKCADISNEIRPSHIGKQWAECVMTEFFIQVGSFSFSLFSKTHSPTKITKKWAIEKEKGLPSAPTMDPDKTNLANGQIGFISFLCLPLFTEVAKLFPLMEVCTKQMNENKAAWQVIEAQFKTAAQQGTTNSTNK